MSLANGVKLTSDFCVKLTCFIPSDALQKNSAKETRAGSEVNVEMASGCRNTHRGKCKMTYLFRPKHIKGMQKDAKDRVKRHVFV